MTLYHEGQIVTIVRAETWMSRPSSFVGCAARVMGYSEKGYVKCGVSAGKYKGWAFYFNEKSLRREKSCLMR